MLVHALEYLEEITVAQAAILLRAFFPDLYQSLLAEDLQLLRHHRLAAPELFIQLGDGSLTVSQDLDYTQPNRVGHRL